MAIGPYSVPGDLPECGRIKQIEQNGVTSSQGIPTLHNMVDHDKPS